MRQPSKPANGGPGHSRRGRFNLEWPNREFGQGSCLAEVAESAGLFIQCLESAVLSQRDHLRKLLQEHQQDLLKAGYWGVPRFSFSGEAFYGQNRFDRPLWRMGMSEKNCHVDNG